MNLIIALFLSVTIAQTGKVLSTTSAMKFESIEECEDFVLRMSKGYPYYRSDDGILVLTDPRTGNIVNAKCFEA